MGMDPSTPKPAKRGRSESLSSTSSAGSLASTDSSATSSRLPLNKVQRASPAPENDSLECNLPPTCFPTSRPFGSKAELERHQLAFHTFVCRAPVRIRGDQAMEGSTASGSSVDPWAVPREFSSTKGRKEYRECRKIFPDERLLELHSEETHNAIKRAQQKEGISIFQCFVPPPECTRLFINPKHRRMHLIHKHHYPEQYFFSVTCHGLNRIAEEEGLGASLIRPKRDHRDSMPPEPVANTQPAVKEKEAVVDVEMEELTKGLSSMESSLTMIPVQLRRSGRKKMGDTPKPSVRDN